MSDLSNLTDDELQDLARRCRHAINDICATIQFNDQLQATIASVMSQGVELQTFVDLADESPAIAEQLQVAGFGLLVNCMNDRSIRLEIHRRKSLEN